MRGRESRSDLPVHCHPAGRCGTFFTGSEPLASGVGWVVSLVVRTYDMSPAFSMS